MRPPHFTQAAAVLVPTAAPAVLPAVARQNGMDSIDAGRLALQKLAGQGNRSWLRNLNLTRVSRMRTGAKRRLRQAESRTGAITPNPA
jgi:hypothetical protein